MEFKATLDDPEGSEEERAARVRETYRLMCVTALRGAEFLRLLRLAQTEGLLAELMQAAGCESGQEVPRPRGDSEASNGRQTELKTRSTPLPL
jgi:hypothetical protein